MIVRLKQPAEALRLSIPVASPIRIDPVVIAARGLVPGAPPLLAVATIASGPAGGVELALSAGGDGERYLVTITIECADGQIVEREAEVAVVDGAWAMPDGGAPYLSIAAFVEAVGFDDVLAQTDDGTGRIDRAMLTRALVAAQADIDAHLAERYAVPLPAVPTLIETLMVDLARVRLYPRGAPEGVADAGKAAAKRLERIQSGGLKLGVPTVAVPPAPEATDTPVVFAAGRRAYPDGLADY